VVCKVLSLLPCFDRLSREEKDRKALEKAIAESKTSGTADETTSVQVEVGCSSSSEHAQDTSKDEVSSAPLILPCKTKEESKDRDSSEDGDFSPGEEDEESDDFSPKQTLDSDDDDFQPKSTKTSRSKAVSTNSAKARKVQSKGKAKKTPVSKGRGVTASPKAEVTPDLATGATSTVQKAQLPGAKMSTTALSRHAGKSSTASSSPSSVVTSGKSLVKTAGLSRMGKSSPLAKNVGISVGTGGAPVRSSGCPVIRVGLSRKAPVKQLHKLDNIT